MIAQPGFVPDTATQINIADWAQGGHVVRADPQLQSPDTGISMLSPDPILNLEYPRNVTSLSWVISSTTIASPKSPNSAGSIPRGPSRNTS